MAWRAAAAALFKGAVKGVSPRLTRLYVRTYVQSPRGAGQDISHLAWLAWFENSNFCQ